ncbi:MAG: DUF1292 domain-containing protein [Clostridia bacterium]|jgi:hypothetical protein|nr:DUF1292 domain-containing protein [Clostridia bacterium]
MQEEEFTILLTDEEGSEIECELLDRIELEGEVFSVLLPLDDDSSEPEAIILRESPEGELEGFDDAELLDKVFKLFLERNGMA